MAQGGLSSLMWSSMPSFMTVATLATLAMSALGCVERDPFNAGDVAAADSFHCATGGGAGRSVGCRCDSEGGLHVQAPQGATVRVVESSEDAEASITIPAPAEEQGPGTRLRHTVSLGFAGDGKLTELPSSQRAAWGGPDSASGGSGTYVRFGYGGGGRAYGSGPSSGGFRTRGVSAGRAGNSQGGAPSGGGLIFSPHVHRTMVAGGGHTSGSSGRSGGGSHGPR